MKATTVDIYSAIEFSYLSWVWAVEGREAIIEHRSYNAYKRVDILGGNDWEPNFLFREDLLIRRLAAKGGLVSVLGCTPANAELLRQFKNGLTEFNDDVVELHEDFHIMVWCDQRDRKQYRSQYSVKRIGFLADFKEIT